MKPPVFYNRLEVADPPSVNGPAGVDFGVVSYPAGLWDNCVRVNGSNESVDFSDPLLDFNELVIEFQVKTDYNIVNGEPSDAVNHNPFDFRFTKGGARTMLFYFAPTSGIYLLHTDGNLFFDTTTDWALGTWNHVAIVLSRSANFDGAKTNALYINGVQTAGDNTALTDLSGASSVTLYLGTPITRNQPLDGEVDNIKIWGYATANVVDLVAKNKGNERFGLNDQVMAA